MSGIVYFERCLKGVYPCMEHDAVIEWHFRHGWVWNLIDRRSGDAFGCCFCTLLCGSGSVIHFSIIPGLRLSAALIRSAMRKGIMLAAGSCDVVYATIPRDREGLLRVVQRLGFCEVRGGGFLSAGSEMVLLKYCEKNNWTVEWDILKEEAPKKI